MSALTPLVLAKSLVVALAFGAVACAGWGLTSDAEAWPERWRRRYVAWLDAALAALFLPPHGRWLLLGQLLGLESVALAGIWSGRPLSSLVCIPLLLAPAAWLRFQRRRRVSQIEAQVDTFLLTLAGALRATPSLGRALEQTQRSLPAPLAEELARLLGELRVGSSVELALLDLGRRVGSETLDAALLAVLVGREVGGELTTVLETTAATLREMARLRGVLRAKTAESRAQLWVLVFTPPLVMFAFDAVKPGYFEPLLASSVGWLLIGVATLLWVASVFVARHVLAVKL